MQLLPYVIALLSFNADGVDVMIVTTTVHDSTGPAAHSYGETMKIL